MSDMYNVSASPHIRGKATTKTIMRDVVIALLPATIFGIWNFGLHALILVLGTCVTAVLTEYVYEKLMKRPITTSDYSALITGLLLALNLPPELPLWMAIIGAVFAIVIVKQLFGGLGQNFMNPALAARCFMLISFTKSMTTFTLDGVSSATPLAQLKAGNAVNLMDMFTGKIEGTIGETSVIAILIGALYLVARKVISLRIPLIYIGTVVVFAAIFGGRGLDANYLLGQVCGGGLMLGAFFMATDYVTSPITPRGQIVYGIFLGIMTGIFRIFGASAEGVSYAIIFCNLFVPLIERVTVPKAFGLGGKHE